ncbi:MAG: hypothetical protein R3229_03040 [Alphaproteobacteria bacterium]|nr:hypothetical protein [Alphaproteobacteria bacterium]
MTGRGTATGGSILISCAIGILVLGILMLRPESQSQRPVTPPVKPKAQAEPRKRPKPPSAQSVAIRLPPPPAPASAEPRTPQSPKTIAAMAPPPGPKTAPVRARPRRAPHPAKAKPTAPKPPRTRAAAPKAAAIRRTTLDPPPLIPPQAKTAAARPAPTARPPRVPAAKAATVVPTRATRREGRTLLKLLEYGKGPAIEIAWPEGEGQRDRLYRQFRNCYGMRNALMGADGRLYGESGPVGGAWAINLDRYSGFVRHPAGRTVAAERRQARDIAARHGIDGRVVRVFPRTVDAVILGGLHQVIGTNYKGARTITARYQRRHGRLLLGAIRVDGKPLDGAVDISTVKRRGCRA